MAVILFSQEPLDRWRNISFFCQYQCLNCKVARGDISPSPGLPFGKKPARAVFYELSVFCFILFQESRDDQRCRAHMLPSHPVIALQPLASWLVFYAGIPECYERICSINLVIIPVAILLSFQNPIDGIRMYYSAFCQRAACPCSINNRLVRFPGSIFFL